MTTTKTRVEEYASRGLRHKAEVAVVRALLDECRKAGFSLSSIEGGEEHLEVRTDDQALDIVFDLDDCWILFQRPGSPDWHGARIVLGNNGDDAISDWDCSDPAFNAAVEAAVKRAENITVTC